MIRKILFGTIAASLVATAVLCIWGVISLVWLGHSEEILPQDVLEFAPIIFAFVFFAGSWAGGLFTYLLRLTGLSDFQASAWAGFANGLVWGLVASRGRNVESVPYYLTFCIAGFLAGIAFWFVVYRNKDEVTSLSLLSSVKK
ncbi:MAG: hypothetical protein HY231_10855 [Acidobacteria bacterium]|nr:hypothetical protein [Acidobacteriota bacterium]